MRWLREATSVNVPIGPFLDETDGKTPETALTITQPDILLKKNGSAWAQKNAAQTLSHESNGFYEVTLDAVDTNTLGLLRLHVLESGALIVWEDFMVVRANAYDSLVLDADLLDVAGGGGGGATAAEVADAVWDEPLAGHGTAGSAGERLGRVPNAAAGAAGGLPTVDAGNRLAGIAGTITTLDALDTAQDVQHAASQSSLSSIISTLSGIVASTAAAVWNSVTSGYTTAGTFGNKFRLHGEAVLVATVAAGSGTGLVVLNATTGINGGAPSSTNDFYNGGRMAFVTGVLAGQRTDITDYVGGTKTLSVVPLTSAPAAGDVAVIF